MNYLFELSKSQSIKHVAEKKSSRFDIFKAKNNTEACKQIHQRQRENSFLRSDYKRLEGNIKMKIKRREKCTNAVMETAASFLLQC